MTLYNITALANATNVSDIFAAANSFTGGILFGLFTLAMFFIMVMSFRNRTLEDNLIVSGWLSFIISLLFSFARLLPFIWIIGYLALTTLAIIWKVTTRRE
jgi:hypothetical protein